MSYTIIEKSGIRLNFYTIRRDDGKVAVITWHVRTFDGDLQLMGRKKIDERKDGSPVYSWPYCGVVKGDPAAAIIAALESGAVALGSEFWT